MVIRARIEPSDDRTACSVDQISHRLHARRARRTPLRQARRARHAPCDRPCAQSPPRAHRTRSDGGISRMNSPWLNLFSGLVLLPSAYLPGAPQLTLFARAWSVSSTVSSGVALSRTRPEADMARDMDAPLTLAGMTPITPPSSSPSPTA